MGELPKAAVERLIKGAGASRVSASAVEALSEILEDVAMDVASQSASLARHAGRKTVTADDVKLAAKS
jgi:histone H3/H4